MERTPFGRRLPKWSPESHEGKITFTLSRGIQEAFPWNLTVEVELSSLLRTGRLQGSIEGGIGTEDRIGTEERWDLRGNWAPALPEGHSHLSRSDPEALLSLEL